MRLRTGYSFRTAMGHLEEVMATIETEYAPITDRASTFGFTRWEKLCRKNNKRPIYGIELAVTPEPTAKKVTRAYFTFIALNDIQPINELLQRATAQFRYEPLLTYDDLLSLPDGLAVIVGGSALPELMDAQAMARNGNHVYYPAHPSTTSHVRRWAEESLVQPIACSDNFYVSPDDREPYEVLCGRGKKTQSYPLHILSRDEMKVICGDQAVKVADQLADECCSVLKRAELLEPEKKKSLLQMCEEGAEKLGCDLTDQVYRDRLDRELGLIEDKEFEDYFYIIADLIEYSKRQMFVGPARGSSCGSLVCYLLGITTIDPIPYDLIFERFIDVNRDDLPDIDIDFSDSGRQLAFDYLEQKYGVERVARLGVVALYKPKSAINETAAALSVPKWKVKAFTDSIIERSGGDSRALQAIEDTFNDTDTGRKLLEEFPEMIVCQRLEGHPRHYSQHAAGVVVTQEPVNHFAAIDNRTKALHCDKKDAEDLNLLKIDALGLTQLSVFEDCLKMIGKPHQWLLDYPTDDPAAFAILNDHRWSGIFQWNGQALQSLTQQVHMNEFEDMVAITALARPGPLVSGGATQWVDRKNGKEPVTYLHEEFEEHLNTSLGIVIYQEQIMSMGRDIGGLSWEDVSSLRKAMSKSMGKEFFDQYGDRFKAGAQRLGLEQSVLDKLWDDLCAYGAWSFNRCLSKTSEIKIANCPPKTKGSATIESLYDRYVANPSPWIRQKKSMPIVWSMDGDGRIVKQRVKDIVKNGKKQVNRYTFCDGSSVECTEDHKFLINGKWQPVKSASIGSSFKFAEKPEKDLTSGEGKGHAKGKSWSIESSDRSGKNNVAYKNGLSVEKEKFKKENSEKSCEDCGEKKNRMEAHHNDFSAGRERPEDLAWLCAGCHKKRHYKQGRTKRDGIPHQIVSKKLVSIDEVGVEETYDLVMPDHHNFLLESGLITHNSHSVAYGYISYWCCALKAHYPLEFAAATLSHERLAEKQIKMLREMVAEGYEYVPVDAELSTDKWQAGDGKLIGPLTNVKGLGPKLLKDILRARATGEELPKRAQTLLKNPETPIDELEPVRKRLEEIYPDGLESAGITSQVTEIIDAQCDEKREKRFIIVAKAQEIRPRDGNELASIQKRGYKLKGNAQFLNLVIEDDSDQMLARVNRFKYEPIGRKIVDEGGAGDSIYVFDGTVSPDFRILNINRAKLIGKLKSDFEPA